MPEPRRAMGRRRTPSTRESALLPNLLYLTQSNGSLIAIDAAKIYLIRPSDLNPFNIDGPRLTCVSLSTGPGVSLSFEVRESVEQIGALLAAIADGASITFNPAEVTD